MWQKSEGASRRRWYEQLHWSLVFLKPALFLSQMTPPWPSTAHMCGRIRPSTTIHKKFCQLWTMRLQHKRESLYSQKDRNTNMTNAMYALSSSHPDRSNQHRNLTVGIESPATLKISLKCSRDVGALWYIRQGALQPLFICKRLLSQCTFLYFLGTSTVLETPKIIGEHCTICNIYCSLQLGVHGDQIYRFWSRSELATLFLVRRWPCFNNALRLGLFDSGTHHWVYIWGRRKAPITRHR